MAHTGYRAWLVGAACLALSTSACGSKQGGVGTGGSGSGVTGGSSGGGSAGSAGGSGGRGGVAGSGGVAGTLAGGGGTTPGGRGGSAGSGGRASGGAAGTIVAEGGNAGSGGVASTVDAAAGGGAAGSGGALGTGGALVDAGPTASCTSDLLSRVRVTETDLGVVYAYNEVDNNGPALGLTPLAISPVPGGGSRVAFLGKSDGLVHVATLDADDQMVPGSLVDLPGYDVQDIYADDSGGVLLISRTALGATANNNCGDINNLCGLVANYPTSASCYDMYMVRFDGNKETWATKLTDTKESLPAYGTSATTGDWIIYIWSQYAHNGRIAFDGADYAGYFGAAVTVPGQDCVGDSTLSKGVNIHQGDRMKLVNRSGELQKGGFDWGCSHSGYERVVWDPLAKKLVTVCKNDAAAGGKSGRLAFPSPTTTIYPVDLAYSNFGSLLVASGGGYWLLTSDIRPGQPAGGSGLADIHLLHVAGTSSPSPDDDIVLAGDGNNHRAPHLAAYGEGMLLAAWEDSTATGDLAQKDGKRQMYLQVLDSATGVAPGGSTAASAGPLALPTDSNVLGSRYQDFRAFPDGSAAYPAPGSSSTKIRILRVLPCS